MENSRTNISPHKPQAKPPKGPFRLLTVNTSPERARRLVGRVVDNLADRYTIVHADNCASIDAVRETLERVKPDVLVCKSSCHLLPPFSFSFFPLIS